jgi:AraC-like DNA-binding protein
VCQKRFQQTAQAYQRSRRLQRAHHLLQHTTRRVKEIAVEVGLADLQRFNKAIRREYGCAPRALRRPGR